MVAGGHKTTAPSPLTYYSVVYQCSVRIALTFSALGSLNIFACDIHNAYLIARFWNNICTVVGPELSSTKGKVVLFSGSIYRMKSSGADFRALLVE